MNSKVVKQKYDQRLDIEIQQLYLVKGKIKIKKKMNDAFLANE